MSGSHGDFLMPVFLTHETAHTELYRSGCSSLLLDYMLQHVICRMYIQNAVGSRYVSGCVGLNSTRERGHFSGTKTQVDMGDAG